MIADPFEASVAAAGRSLDRAATRDGSRGIGVATRRDGAVRELVTVVGPGVPRAALEEHPGWDLPLVTAHEIETSSGPRTFVAELLPAGVPSTWLDASVDASRSRTVAPFAIELARRVADEHARGGVIGPVHPATVLVEPDARTLLAVAQRPLRIARVVAVEGDRPLLGYGTSAPGDLAGEAPSATDDVFRLAIMLWQWRHGAHPFGNVRDGELAAALGRLVAGEAVDLPGASDELDRRILACLVPSPAARPSAGELVAALAAAG